MTTLEQAQYAQGEIYVKEGLALARQIGLREWASLAFLNLAEAGMCQRHYSAAREYAEEGLALARQIDHREWIGAHLVNLAVVAREEGNYTQAETYLQECLELLLQISRPGLAAEAFYAYGTRYLVTEQTEGASVMFDRMIQVIPQGDRQLTALWQYGKARLALALGKIDEARKLGEASHACLTELGNSCSTEVENWLATLEQSNPTVRE